MNKIIILFAGVFLYASCHSTKEKTNEAIKKTGETLAEGTSEFVKGVKQGIARSFDSEVDISEDLKNKGLETGKILVADSSGQEDILSLYIIFNKDFDEDVVVKVIDKNGQEYGRISRNLSGKKNEAGFVDFYFPGRTSFESKSTFIFEKAK